MSCTHADPRLNRLLPTNCTRACTTCVTEVRYNDEDDGYRAEVEFISSDEWSDEIHVLINDLCVDCEGTSDRKVSPDYASGDTNAGVAFTKLTAVYPSMTVQTIPNAQQDMLLADPDVQKVLGKTFQLRDTSAKGLFSQIQGYVESNDMSEEKKMQHWPLLKVVRVFTKAEALSTGAVIVDLVGCFSQPPFRSSTDIFATSQDYTTPMQPGQRSRRSTSRTAPAYGSSRPSPGPLMTSPRVSCSGSRFDSS